MFKSAAEAFTAFISHADKGTNVMELRTKHQVKRNDNKYYPVDLSAFHVKLDIMNEKVIGNKLILTTTSTHRPVYAIETLFKNKQYKRFTQIMQPIIYLCNLVGQNLLILLIFLFVYNPKAFEFIFECLLQLNRKHFLSSVKAVIQKSNNEPMDIDRILLIKDAIHLPDRPYYHFTSYTGLTGCGIMPYKTKMVTHHLDITKKCIQQFDVKVKSASIKQKVKDKDVIRKMNRINTQVVSRNMAEYEANIMSSVSESCDNVSNSTSSTTVALNTTTIMIAPTTVPTTTTHYYDHCANNQNFRTNYCQPNNHHNRCSYSISNYYYYHHRSINNQCTNYYTCSCTNNHNHTIYLNYHYTTITKEKNINQDHREGDKSSILRSC